MTDGTAAAEWLLEHKGATVALIWSTGTVGEATIGRPYDEDGVPMLVGRRGQAKQLEPDVVERFVRGGELVLRLADGREVRVVPRSEPAE